LRNELKERWSAGDAVHGAWIGIPDAMAAEVLGSVGFDYLCVDMQHGLADYSRAVDIFRALESAECVPIARVPWNEPGIIGRVLDAGAMGVIIPMVNSPEEALAAVRACRYAPEGARSWGPTRAARVHENYSVQAANESVACIPMIETRQAVEAIDDILATPGIDAIYVGPADLSITYGLPPAADNEGDFVAALDTIVAACERHGVVPGIHANPALAQKRRDQGFRMITVCNDMQALEAGAAAMLEGATTGKGGANTLY